MADPLSFAASLIAVTTLASTVGLKGYHYLQAAAGRNAEVKQLLAGVHVLCGVLKQLEQLVTFPSTYDTEVNSVAADGSSPDADERATNAEIENELNKFSRQVTETEDAEHDYRPWDVRRLKRLSAQDLKWSWARSRTMGLMIRLDQLKSTCCLALHEYEISSIHKVLMDSQSAIRTLERLTAGSERLLDIKTTEEQEKALSWLSDDNPANKHRSFRSERCEGTGLWFFDLPEVKDWLDAPQSFLWVYGIPGAGKTIISTLVVDTVLKSRRSPTTGAAYFYVRHDDKLSQETSNVIGSLVSQLARQNSNAMDVVSALWKTHTKSDSLPTRADEADLLDALLEITACFTETYILIDGLDESRVEYHVERERLLKTVSTFQDRLQVNVHVIIFSRKITDIERALENYHQISIAAVNADLRLYISQFLSDREHHSPELAAEITDTLLEKAEGMFVWVRAQLDYLQRLPNDPEKRRALQQLPPDLYSTYARIFESITVSYPPQTCRFIRRALWWMTLELDFDSLRWCIGPDGMPVFSTAHLISAIQIELERDWTVELQIRRGELLRWLGCLVHVDEQEGTEIIRLSHFTVKEFLRSDRTVVSSNIAGSYCVGNHSEAQVADLCAAYLLHPSFGTMFPDSWIQTGQEIFAMNRLFRFYEWAWICLIAILNRNSHVWHRAMASKVDQFFAHPRHQNFSIATQFGTWLPVGYVLPPNRTEGDLELGPNPESDEGVYRHKRLPSSLPKVTVSILQTPLSLACTLGLECYVQYLLHSVALADEQPTLIQMVCFGNRFANWTEDYTLSIDAASSSPFDPFWNGCTEGDRSNRTRILEALVTNGYNPAGVLDLRLIDTVGDHHAKVENYRVCAPCTVLGTGFFKAASVFFGRGMDLQCFQTPSATHLPCDVPTLLRYGEGIEAIDSEIESLGNPACTNTWRAWRQNCRPVLIGPEQMKSTTLQDLLAACEHGQAWGDWDNALSKLKLIAPSELNGEDSDDLVAIHVAASADRKVLQAFIDRGAKVDRADRNGRTALMCATDHGLEENVLLLLENNADARLAERDGTTATHYAARRQSTECLKLLLEHGADPNASSERMRFPLFDAVWGNNQPAIDILISNGTNVDQADQLGRTTLHSAAECQFEDSYDVLSQETGLLDMVLELLKYGATIDPKDTSGRTPLHLAAKYGHDKVVRSLLDAGAAIDHRSHSGEFALFCAARSGQLEVVKALLDAGAEVDLEDNSGATPLHISAAAGHKMIVDLLLVNSAAINHQARDSSNALHIAIEHDHCEIVQTLLNRKAGVNTPGPDNNTPILVAARSAGDDMVRLLIDAGADISATRFDGTGVLALSLQNSSHHREAVFYRFVAAGAASIGPNHFGTTAIHIACEFDGCAAMLCTILEQCKDRGLEVNRSDYCGTPLYSAAGNRCLDIARLLVAAGADPNANCPANALGPAVMVATAFGHIDMVQYLVANGARLTHPEAKFSSVHGTARAFKRVNLLEQIGPEEDADMDLNEAVHVDGITDPNDVSNLKETREEPSRWTEPWRGATAQVAAAFVLFAVLVGAIVIEFGHGVGQSSG